jgi:pyruvate,water dikinase
LQQRGVGNHLAGGIVVQALISAEVAGVLMTRDPLDWDQPHMLVEASWGLGESVVSGRVTPDRYWIDRADHSILKQEIGFKPTRCTESGVEAVPDSLHHASCLTPSELTALAEIGRTVEAQGEPPQPCDIEWARKNNKFWLLQARPITTYSSAELGLVRKQAIDAARRRRAAGGTTWFRNAFCRELPEPTPMTWSVLQSLFSGSGGFGRMYRDLGFHPDESLDESGSYEVICGRLYCNLDRELLFYANGLPLAYDHASLRSHPETVQHAQPQLDWTRAGNGFWRKLPRLLGRSAIMPWRLQRACSTLLKSFSSRVVPEFLVKVKQAEPTDWSELNESDLYHSLQAWISRTLVDFARHAMKASVLAAHLESGLTQSLTKLYDAATARNVLTELASGVELDPAIDLPRALRALATGSLDRRDFLAQFGHRSNNEWELAQPRWGERPDSLDNLIRQANTDHAHSAHGPIVPLPSRLQNRAERLRRLLALRELARHHMLKGCNIIRRILLALDSKFGLAGEIFYLSVAELEPSTPYRAYSATLMRRQNRLALSLPVPDVLFSDDLEAIGRPSSPIEAAGASFRGTPLSPGVVEGVAFAPGDPAHCTPPPEPFVLVCACTDPAWIPLAAQARGLVTETGGILSHGAILARELALPAVGGVFQARERLANGVRVRVDGSQGLVTISSC